MKWILCFRVLKQIYYLISYRHLFLGQMLLLGLLLGSCVGFAYAVEPNEFSCAAVKLGTGLSYGLIYTSLLVKQIFLISLNSGVYLPASYQAILFLFIIITQVTKNYLKNEENLENNFGSILGRDWHLLAFGITCL